jgi:hypothetical protein
MKKTSSASPGVAGLALERVAQVAAAVDPQLPVRMRGGHRLPRLDQQVEALLRRVEPARGDDDLALRPRALAAERRHRVGEADDARRAAERGLVVTPVVLGQHRERAEAAVSGCRTSRASPLRWRLKFMCSWATVTVPSGASAEASTLKLGRVPITTPPRIVRRRRSSSRSVRRLHHG